MDIVKPMCSMYWKEISYSEYLELLEAENLEEEPEEEEEEPEEVNPYDYWEPMLTKEQEWAYRRTVSGYLAGMY